MLRHRVLSTAALVAAAIALGLPPAEGAVEPGFDPETVAALQRQAGGVVVATGKVEATAALPVTDYRVERLDLRRAVRAVVDGKTRQVRRVWRVVVTGGPFAPRALPAVLSIGGKPVAVGLESPDLGELSFVLPASVPLRTGAALALSYGEGDARAELTRALDLSLEGTEER